jgi:hypothetical protein
MFPILENCVEGLHLKLADGQEWSLVAVESVRPWLQKFGAALRLELRKNRGLRKIIFCQSTLFARKGSITDIRRMGWKRHDLGVMHLWTHRLVADIVCEIGHEESSHDVDVLRMWCSVGVIQTKAVESSALPLHAGLVVQNGVRSGARRTEWCGQVHVLSANSTTLAFTLRRRGAGGGRSG